MLVLLKDNHALSVLLGWWPHPAAKADSCAVVCPASPHFGQAVALLILDALLCRRASLLSTVECKVSCCKDEA